MYVPASSIYSKNSTDCLRSDYVVCFWLELYSIPDVQTQHLVS